MGLLRSLAAWPERCRPKGAKSIRCPLPQPDPSREQQSKKPDDAAALSAGCGREDSCTEKFAGGVSLPRLDSFGCSRSHKSCPCCDNDELQAGASDDSCEGLCQSRIERAGGGRRWAPALARHGSTRYRWTRDAVRAAIQYAVHEQGESMAVFETPFPR
jgi:hypothetical protein